MNIVEIKTRLPNSSMFQPARRSPVSIRQPRSSSLSSSRNAHKSSPNRTNIPVHHFGVENSKQTNFSYFKSIPSSPLPSRFGDNTGKYLARILNNSPNKPTVISTSSSYFQPNNEAVTTLPVYYQKDGSGFTLPIIRNSSGYLKNISTANSGVGSVSSVLRPNSNLTSRSNYTVGSREPSPSPFKTLSKQYSMIKENQDQFETDSNKPLYVGKVCIAEPVLSVSSKSGLNRDFLSSSLNNLSRNYSNTSLNGQTNAPSKSILVNRKKFANPPRGLSLASPVLPKKTVTFAE